MYRHYCGAQRVSPYTVFLYTIVQVSLSSISNRIRSNSPLYHTKLPGKQQNKLKTGSQLLKNFSGGALPPQTPRAPLAFTLCVKACSALPRVRTPLRGVRTLGRRQWILWKICVKLRGICAMWKILENFQFCLPDNPRTREPANPLLWGTLPSI